MTLEKQVKSPPFAKLYNADRGQILVVLNLNDDDGPTLAVTVDPGGIYGLCTTKGGYDDTDDGRRRAQEAFDGMTDEKVMGLAGKIYKMADGLSGE